MTMSVTPAIEFQALAASRERDRTSGCTDPDGAVRTRTVEGPMLDARILVVDDDRDILTAARLLLKRHVTAVTTANQPERILALMAETAFDAVLLDMNFVTGAQSGKEGLSWL